MDVEGCRARPEELTPLQECSRIECPLSRKLRRTFEGSSWPKALKTLRSKSTPSGHASSRMARVDRGSDITTTRLQRSLDGVLDKAVADRTIVGGVPLVSSQGQPVYSRAVGFADREAQRKAQLDTIFRWSSLTKPVLATLTLALAERGTISLEDPVTRFLPKFRPRLPGGQVPEIRVRHLLSTIRRWMDRRKTSAAGAGAVCMATAGSSIPRGSCPWCF